MNSDLKPIFLFSLPRSGSTLLQRILASHKHISTVSEPWILLPFFYTLKDRGIYTEYGQNHMVKAIEDFFCELSKGRDDYLEEMKAFILRLYTKAAKNGSKYFLDKTPRYHLIAEDIIQLFPEGKFIFLWRNPLSMVASTIEFSNNGKLFYAYKVDFFNGVTNLISTYEKHSELIHAVCFEHLIVDGESELRKLFNYLDLPFNPEVLLSFSNLNLKGQMGDKEGVKQYKSISTDPLKKWRSTLANPVRKAWCRRYLKWIGRERLDIMGYDLDGLLGDLNTIPSSLRNVGIDIVSVVYSIVRNTLELRMMKHKLQALPEWYRIHIHT